MADKNGSSPSPHHVNGGFPSSPSGNGAPPRIPGSIEDQQQKQIEMLQNRLERVFNDATLYMQFGNRAQWMQSLLDPRRDIDAECGYPDSGAIVDVAVYRLLYDREQIANRVVHMYPKECWQSNPDIFEDENGEETTEFEQTWADLEVGMVGGSSWHQDAKGSTIFEHLHRADVLAGIGHYGCILLGLDDGKDLQEPVDGAVTVPEGYNPQGSISQTGSITSGIEWDDDLEMWVPKHGYGTTPGNVAQGGGAPPVGPHVRDQGSQSGKGVQGTDEQYSTGQASTSPADQDQGEGEEADQGEESDEDQDQDTSGGGNEEEEGQEDQDTSANPPGQSVRDQLQQTLSSNPSVKDLNEQATPSTPAGKSQKKTGKVSNSISNDSLGSPVGDVWAAIGDHLKQRISDPGYGRIFLHLPTKTAWYVAADGDESDFIGYVQHQLSQVRGVKKVRVEAESSPPRDEGWWMVYPKQFEWSSAGAAENTLNYLKQSHRSRLFHRDSPITNEEVQHLKKLGTAEGVSKIVYKGLDGKDHERAIAPLTTNELKAVEQWDRERQYTFKVSDGMYINNSRWRCNYCRSRGHLHGAVDPDVMTQNSLMGLATPEVRADTPTCPVCNSKRVVAHYGDLQGANSNNPMVESGVRSGFFKHQMFNKVTEARDARGKTVFDNPGLDNFSQPNGPQTPSTYQGTGGQQYDGSEYSNRDPAWGGPSGGSPSAMGYDDPYKGASGVNYSSAAGYGLPSGVAMPAGALSGTDQQYFGVQFGPSEVMAPTPPKGKQRKLLFLRCFDESLVQIVRYEWNVRNPRFGLPVMYRITLNDPREQHSGVGLPLATVFVHWSRVIHIIDNYQSSGTSEIFGVPRMRPVLNRLLDLRKIYSGGGEGYWRSVVANLFFVTHPQLGGDVNIDTAGIANMMEQMQNGLQRWGALSGMAPQTTPIDLKDPSPHVNTQLEAIAIQIGCPIRVLKGSERGELASSQDDSKWNDRVKHRQNFHVTPMIIVQFIDRLIQIGVLPTPKGYTVRWPDLDANTDAQKAQIAMTVSQALGAYVSQNVESLITPHKMLTKYLDWDDDEATEELDNTKQVHADQDTMSNPPMVSGQPAAPAEGTAAGQRAQDLKDANQAKADAIAQSGNNNEQEEDNSGPLGSAGGGSPGGDEDEDEGDESGGGEDEEEQTNNVRKTLVDNYYRQVMNYMLPRGTRR
jgi:hypothetical protein